MNNSNDERRRDVRIYRNFILSFHEKGKSRGLHNVYQVNNVSKGGLSFSLTHPLKQGAVVIIDLRAPFISDDIHLEGLVLECREKIPDMIYEIRVQFQEISEQALKVLEKIESYDKPRGD